MTQLIIINGAPGVGKTFVGNIIFERLNKSAFLVADNVWQINPFEVNNVTKALVEDNIVSVLRNYISAGYEYVILDWVLHQQKTINKILNRLNDLAFSVHIFTLTCNEDILLERIAQRIGKKTNSDVALDRLRQSLTLQTKKIDTTKLIPGDIADKIISLLNRS